MKSFDDFLKYANENVLNDVQNVPLSIDGKIELTSANGISELLIASNERTMKQLMILLRAYHEWSTEK